MAVQRIRYYPDPILDKVAEPVTDFGDELQSLLEDMFDTMYDAQGVGIAAPQIGVSKSVMIIDEDGDKKKPLIFVNPEIIEKSDPVMMQEGCLSVPGVWEKIERCKYAKIKAQDRNGKEFTMEGHDLLAHAFQHELDHLKGTLFIKYLSPFKLGRAKKKIEKFKKQNGLV